MPILTDKGRIAISKAMKQRTFHLAWGTGDGTWSDTPPAENPLATGLIAEIGRKTVTQIEYVSPNPGGSIILPDGTFEISATPTNSLYFRTQFDYLDGGTSLIREIGLFMDTVMVGGLPGGQTYFVPANISDPGLLVHLEHFSPIIRSASIREAFEIVITF